MKSLFHDHHQLHLLLGLCFVLSGCVGPTNPVQEVTYYTFSYDPPPSQEIPRLPAVLQLDAFTTAPLYNTEKMVYKPERFQRKVYNYHRWQSIPGELVAYYLARDMKASSRFAAVLTQPGRLSPTHLLTGTVDEIFEDDSPNGWQAVIGLTVTLINASERNADRAVIFQKTYKMSESSASRNPSAVVSAMSSAMSMISKRVIADVFVALSE
jgi:cholesterol transport system auxiliary component